MEAILCSLPKSLLPTLIFLSRKKKANLAADGQNGTKLSNNVSMEFTNLSTKINLSCL